MYQINFCAQQWLLGIQIHDGFGLGRGYGGTFGHNIPGRRIQAMHIEDINPADCCGYKNIFLHCGINNINIITLVVLVK